MQSQSCNRSVIEPYRLGALVQAGLLAGPFMSMIDSSVVNVALPDMATQMHTSLAMVQWVASAYLLALGMALAGTAYLAKRFGTKQIYFASLVTFTMASVLCAISPGVRTLIFFRILQGVFGAPLVPLAMNMLLGKGKAGQQMSAVAGMILFLVPAVGPGLGGVLLHSAGWPSIFLVNVPVGIIAIIGALRLPHALTARKINDARFDTLGFILLSAGVIGITYGSSQGTQIGWLSSSTWPYWATGALLLAAYVLWSKSRLNPIVDLSLLWQPQQALDLLLAALVSIVTFAVIFLAPVFMQEIQGTSALTAGIALLPQGLITGIGAILGTQLPGKWGVRQTIVLGMALLTFSTMGLLLVTGTSSAWLIAIVLCGRGFAIGLVIQPLLNRLIDCLPEAKALDGNTLFNVVERISGTLGIALIITFFQVREQLRLNHVKAHLGLPASITFNKSGSDSLLSGAAHYRLEHAAVSGFHDVVWLVAGLSSIGVLIAFFITDHSTLD